MKLFDITQTQPKAFKPVGVVFETKEELEFITKVVGMLSNYAVGRIINKESVDTYPMFNLLMNKCEEYGINTKCGSLTYKEEK